VFVLFPIVGQMYMLSCDSHIDTSDVSVALCPPGMNTHTCRTGNCESAD